MANRETLIDQQKKLKAFIKAYDDLVESFYEFDEAVNSPKAVSAYPLDTSFDEIYFHDWTDAVLDSLYKLAWNDERFRENAALSNFLSRKLGRKISLKESEDEGLSFGKVSNIRDKGADLSKLFKEDELGDQFFAVSRETFTHEEDGLKFNYKYVIEQHDWDTAYHNGDIGDDMYEGLPENEKIETIVSIVPTPDSLKEEVLDSVSNSCGMDTDDIDIRDIYDYGISISFDRDTCGQGGGDKHLLAIANSFDTFEGLFGFYMDAPQNGIGESGWDQIRSWVKFDDDEDDEEELD